MKNITSIILAIICCSIVGCANTKDSDGISNIQDENYIPKDGDVSIQCSNDGKTNILTINPNTKDIHLTGSKTSEARWFTKIDNIQEITVDKENNLYFCFKNGIPVLVGKVTDKDKQEFASKLESLGIMKM